MERIAWMDKPIKLLSKYRYVVLVLVIGIILMLLPSQKDPATESIDETASDEKILTVEEKLSSILSCVDGAGRVEVMLTTLTGEETFYQTNDNHTSAESGSTIQSDTVTVTDDQRRETGLVRQVNPATYLGAIVVCQGADSPIVRLAIVEAVSKVTGLGADSITVLKMK